VFSFYALFTISLNMGHAFGIFHFLMCGTAFDCKNVVTARQLGIEMMGGGGGDSFLQSMGERTEQALEGNERK
jgi:hypothetical protein